LGGDGLRHLPGGVEKLSAGDHLAHQADAQCGGGRQALVGAHQGHAHDLAERHASPEQDRLEGGRHGVGHVRIEERGLLGRDHHVALTEQVKGAAAGHAVDRGHDRFPQVLGLGPDPLTGVLVGEGIELGVDGDVTAVDADAECLLAAAGEHHGPDVVVVP
jgi:hypothetical protein